MKIPHEENQRVLREIRAFKENASKELARSMNITATVGGEIRNEQAGDWRFDDAGNLHVGTVPLGDWRMEFLILFHETIEATLCKHRGIRDEDVCAFDAKFEEERAKGLHDDGDEDGDDPRACYYREHVFATNLERLMAAELGVNWREYEQAIVRYFDPPMKMAVDGVVQPY